MRLDLYELFEKIDIPENLEKVDKNIKIDEIALMNKISSKTDGRLDSENRSDNSKLRKIRELLNNKRFVAVASAVIIVFGALLGQKMYKDGLKNEENKNIASDRNLDNKDTDRKDRDNKLNSDENTDRQSDENSDTEKESDRDANPGENTPVSKDPNGSSENIAKPSNTTTPANSTGQGGSRSNQGTIHRADTKTPQKEVNKPVEGVDSDKGNTDTGTGTMNTETKKAEQEETEGSGMGPGMVDGESGDNGLFNPSLEGSDKGHDSLSIVLKTLELNGWKVGEVLSNEWITLPESFESSKKSDEYSMKYIFLNILSKDSGYDFSSLAGMKVQETTMFLHTNSQIEENRTAKILKLNGKVVGAYIYDSNNILNSESIYNNNIHQILGEDAKIWSDYY